MFLFFKTHKKPLFLATLLALLLSFSHYYQATPIKSRPNTDKEVCDLGQRKCFLFEKTLLKVASHPIEVEEEIMFQIASTEIESIQGNITGINMYMGKIPVIFTETEYGYEGLTFLGACSEPKMEWLLTITAQLHSGNSLTRTITFTTTQY